MGQELNMKSIPIKEKTSHMMKIIIPYTSIDYIHYALRNCKNTMATNLNDYLYQT